MSTTETLTWLTNLLTADKINLSIAVGTFVAAMVAAVSAIYAAKQMTFSRESFRGQTFMNVLSFEREIELSKNIDVIRDLPADAKFETLSNQQRESIRIVVDFLNHIAHLIKYGYVSGELMLFLYTPSIETCNDILIDKLQWLDKFRAQKHSPKFYLHFESLCDQRNRDMIWKGKARRVKWTADPIKHRALS